MRIKSGIHGLDKLLGGGFHSNSVVVVVGTSGTGKTIFSLQSLLEGLKNGKNAIYISFEFTAKDVIRLAKSLGWDEIEEFIDNGMLEIRNFYAENVSLLSTDLVSIVNGAVRAERIVIDSFTPLISPVDMNARRDVNWLFSKLREKELAIVTVEEPLSGDLGRPDVMIPVFLADTVINLKNLGYGEPFSRTIQIIKHRASWHAEGVFPYKILPGLGIIVEGYEVEEEEFSAEDLLRKYRIDELPEELKRKVEMLVQVAGKDAERYVELLIKEYEEESR